MYQNEHGTWAREDLADHLPPLEQRMWLCPECWQKVCDANRMASEPRLLLVDRVKNVAELNLKADVCCRACRATLVEEALVEVY